jgi:DNA-binding response OmpR family regulator
MLLVEDDMPLGEALAEALIDQRYVVDVVNDGEVAWQQVKALAYDLILLDMMLPKLDGVGLCQRLRSHGYGIPILMLTAQILPLTKSLVWMPGLMIMLSNRLIYKSYLLGFGLTAPRKFSVISDS